MTVAPLAYNRLTAAALPYLLLHEVLCHGYQMARTPLLRPNKRAITDPISEGMIDAVAVEFLAERAESDSELSPREASLKHSEAAVAAHIHLARGSRDLQPRFPEADAVALGATAYHLIRRYFAAGGSREHSAPRRLALSLNVHEWEYGDRLTGITELVSSFRKPRDVRTIQLLEEFPSDFDVGRLVEHLRDRARRRKEA